MGRRTLDEVVRSSLGPYVGRAIRLDRFPFVGPVQKMTKEDLREKLLNLLKESPYPYPQARKKNKTMFERLKSKGMLKVLESESAISAIKTALALFEIERLAKESESKEGRERAVQFHRSMIEAIDQHRKRILVILKKYRVDKNWIVDYLAASKAQLDKDFRAIRPLSVPISPASPAKAWNEMVCSVYYILASEFSKAGLARGHKELAIQLTSIICSPSTLFDPGPGISPAAVRKIIQRRKKSRQKVDQKAFSA